MALVKWAVVVLTVLNAGYMVFDGIRAMVTGAYLTPSSGEYAGQLGPWTKAVSAIGIDPLSTLMKSIFVVYGLAWLAVMACFIAGVRWAGPAMLGLAVGSLWYMWMGTVNSLIQIVLLAALLLRRSP